MGAKLHISDSTKYSSIYEMKDGDLAIVIQWGKESGAILGSIIQRYGNSIIVIGKGKGQSYGDILEVTTTKKKNPIVAKNLVRILQKGETIEII